MIIAALHSPSVKIYLRNWGMSRMVKGQCVCTKVRQTVIKGSGEICKFSSLCFSSDKERCHKIVFQFRVLTFDVICVRNAMHIHINWPLPRSFSLSELAASVGSFCVSTRLFCVPSL